MSSPTIHITAGLSESSPSTTTAQILSAHEIFFSRRALSLLKSRLGADALHSLLATDIALADTHWRGILAASNGRYTNLASVTLTCTGLSTASFLSWFKKHVSNLEVMQAAHPEHYLNGLTVLETVGEHVSLFDLEFVEERDLDLDVVKNRNGDRYPVALCARGRMRSGEKEIVGHAIHQFCDIEGGGFEGCFSGWLPAAMDEKMVEMQRAHLAVEWANWMRAAWTDAHGRSEEC